MKKRILIVGGVAGGASAATRLRRLSEEYEIIIFEKGEYPSFANCGLPYHIGGIIPERESLIIQTPEKFKNRFEIDVRVFSKVIQVKPEEKSIVVEKQNGEQYEEKYDFLILSPGAKPVNPPIPGIVSSKIFTLRNIPDMDKIITQIKTLKAKTIAVIGGGFIGIETAENLKHLQLDIHLIEAAPHILAPFDSDFSEELEQVMRENGVFLHLSKKILKFEEEERGIKLFFDDDASLNVDFVVSAIGVQPDTSFLKNSGIVLGEREHILVNEFLQTNYESIYAIGDAIPGFALAGPANRQGRIVANHIAGQKEKYKASIGTSIIKVFDMVGASTGKNERILKQEGTPYQSILLYPNSHAGYYPNATQLHCKILYHRENGKILGAQCIGYESIDKFIDVLAATISFDGDIYDLSELELCYSPPFGSAKSPVNMAGFIGRNIFENLVETVSTEEIKTMDSKKQILLDLRTKEEIENAPITNSLKIPIDELRKRLKELPKDKEILTFCAVGLRGYIASRILTQNGFQVKNLSGGYRYLPKELKKPLKEKLRCSKNAIENTTLANFSIREEVEELNLTGLSCPGSLMKLKTALEKVPKGKQFHVIASDPAFENDVKAFSKRNNHLLLHVTKEKGFVHAYLEKGESGGKKKSLQVQETNDGMTLIVFSGDYDKALASFVLANGAVTMGKKVTMFFTFWGLSVLKKENTPKAKKSFLDLMFSFCLPSSSKKLPLSKMNFAGLGREMVRYVMKKKKLVSLEELREEAKKSGIHMIACTMSMEAMGIQEKELMDGIDFGGVAQYLEAAEQAKPNLFI